MIVIGFRLINLIQFCPVGVPIARGAQCTPQRPDAGYPDSDDSWRSLQHGQNVFQQAREVRHENGCLGRREFGNIF